MLIEASTWDNHRSVMVMMNSAYVDCRLQDTDTFSFLLGDKLPECPFYKWAPILVSVIPVTLRESVLLWSALKFEIRNEIFHSLNAYYFLTGDI